MGCGITKAQPSSNESPAKVQSNGNNSTASDRNKQNNAQSSTNDKTKETNEDKQTKTYDYNAEHDLRPPTPSERPRTPEKVRQYDYDVDHDLRPPTPSERPETPEQVRKYREEQAKKELEESKKDSEEEAIKAKEEELKVAHDREEEAKKELEETKEAEKTKEEENKKNEEQQIVESEEQVPSKVEPPPVELENATQAEQNNEVDQEEEVIEDEDETPFDDDGKVDTDSYVGIAFGLMGRTVDFRTNKSSEELDSKPVVSPGSLYTDEEFPLEMAIVADHSGVEWKRPGEFVDSPKLFCDGTNRYDIGQGSAGTCWFLSTVSNIANNPAMMEQILPKESAYGIEKPGEYDGVFLARFFRFGKWEDVYIDDYLPVLYGNTCWGARSATNNNEMWVALLEKAFARLHGSYDAVYGGQPGDAYLQLTGGIGERLELEKFTNKGNSFFKRVKNAIQSGCHVTCIVPDQFNKEQGLVGGHAYSLVGTAEVRKSKLMRVRNPWGKGEWTGAWSDGSKEWKSIKDKEEIPNKDDGEFYITLDEFLKYFSNVTICSLTPDFDRDGDSDSMNHVLSIFGEWKEGCAGGFQKQLMNPRYAFTITDADKLANGTVPFVVQIIQHSEKRKTDNISMRCDVYKILGDKINSSSRCVAVEFMGEKNNIYTSELQTSFRHELTPGRYCLIPSTIDPGQEKAFLLRAFTAAPLLDVKELPSSVSIVSCDAEDSLKVKGKDADLSFIKTLFGGFVADKNAGGQVSNRDSYHKNPQYLINVPKKAGEIGLAMHIMQTQTEPQYPVGVRLFPVSGETVPLSIDILYEKYNDSPAMTEGGQAKFMKSWDVDAKFVLKPGKYVALVHMDQPDTEKEFAIVFKSDAKINIKGHQTC